MKRLAWLLAASAVGCGDLPPLGEAIVVVDTNVPVPAIVDALRLDLYTLEGRWYESRTVSLPDARDWPASFSVFNPSDEEGRTVLVRLRAFKANKVRDYRGERFSVALGDDLPYDAIVAEPAPTPNELPRLLADDRDVTPPSEPQPRVAIDRIVMLALEEGVRGWLPLTLDGMCAGSMADLANGRSCVATEGVLEPIVRQPLAPRAPSGDSLVGSFATSDGCGSLRTEGFIDGAPLYQEERCVEGGPFFFGNDEHFGVGPASGVPERVAVMSPFRIDRHEVSVARWRQALANGLSPPLSQQLVNDDTLDPDHPEEVRSCTWSSVAMGREHFPMNCVEYENALAFCTFDGGSLPSEAQWELAAQVSGRTRETRYPWGNQTPNCERAVYARSDKTSVFFDANACIAFGIGPVSLDASPMDTSVGLGIVAMGGSMTEWQLDSFAQLDAVCWERAPLHDPACSPTHGGSRSLRGGSWATPVNLVYPGNRLYADPTLIDAPLTTHLGFRCVRPADP